MGKETRDRSVEKPITILNGVKLRVGESCFIVRERQFIYPKSPQDWRDNPCDVAQATIVKVSRSFVECQVIGEREITWRVEDDDIIQSDEKEAARVAKERGEDLARQYARAAYNGRSLWVLYACATDPEFEKIIPRAKRDQFLIVSDELGIRNEMTKAKDTAGMIDVLRKARAEKKAKLKEVYKIHRANVDRWSKRFGADFYQVTA